MSKSLIDLIGNTPLVDVAFENKNKILAKLEGNNPGGSVKDRAALKMIEDAEKMGHIKKLRNHLFSRYLLKQDHGHIQNQVQWSLVEFFLLRVLQALIKKICTPDH